MIGACRDQSAAVPAAAKRGALEPRADYYFPIRFLMMYNSSPS